MSEACGLVALGDSITYGEGGIVLGVDGRSWAQWLARALDVPYVNYAVNGARIADVLAEQAPRVRRAYELGVLYAGVNDVRDPAWDLGEFDRDLRATVAAVAPRCRRLLVATLPLDLGRPRAGAKVRDANAAVRAAAGAVGATVVPLEDFRGWRWVLPDAVHPTALGQLELADRAARALGIQVVPSALVDRERERAATRRFARWWGRQWVREAWRREREHHAG